jgi:aspartate aminotransferase-like enzyme
MPRNRLFIPGPIESPRWVLSAMRKPMISHRGKEFPRLYKKVVPGLKELLYTQGRVFLGTSSASGVMEGAVRNTSVKRILSCTCGAFSERWLEIAKANGKETDAYGVEWGQPNRAEEIDTRLATGQYDCLTLVHNETSTGVMNDLEAISQVLRKYPDVVWCVDAVSSMAGVKIEVDRLGIDVCLAGVQKAFAIPPGLAVFAVSAKALARAKVVGNRGAYYDFVKFAEFDDKAQTPETPAISQINALAAQIKSFRKEGIEARFQRHLQLAGIGRAWARERFATFAPSGYESVTLTTVKNTKGIDVKALIEALKKARRVEIGNGYGKLKDKTFRIAHMGETTVEELKEILGWIDEILPTLKTASA